MDPSAYACLPYDSLKEKPPAFDETVLPAWYQVGGKTVPLTPQFEFIPAADPAGPPPVYVDEQRYAILQQVKDAFDHPNFLEARNATNPFERIGRSIFMNRAAVKMANIDAVYFLTGLPFGFARKTSTDDFHFCDVAAGPGGFTQYLQYRYPLGQGYGMTLKHKTLDWDTKKLNLDRFAVTYGEDGTGSLYTNWDYFIRFVLGHEGDGVDLVMADGGFDIEEGGDKRLFRQQEFLSSRLLLTQAVVGVSCTRPKGSFVLKVFDTVTRFSAQILYLLAQCFEKVTIFKPVTSRPANAERYVVCLGKRGMAVTEPYAQLLADAARTYTDERFLASLFAEELPQEFEEWLREQNAISVDRQLEAARQILLYLQDQNPPVPEYLLNKFLTIWNLPDTPVDRRNSIINVQ